MKYHNITKDDMLNGDGLRVVLWVSGCEHRCEGCHNTITWSENYGIDFDKKAERELFSSANHSYITGITFSGGDPLHPVNRDEIGRLAKKFKEKFPEKTIWLYTGYTFEEIKDLPFLTYVDVLVDGKFISELSDVKLHWRGSSNQRVIDVQKTLLSNQIILHTKD